MIAQIKDYSWMKLAKNLFVTCSAGVAEFSIKESANSTVTRANQGQRLARLARLAG